MFLSRNIQFSRKLDFLIGLWNISISCEFIIFRRKHLFTLKLLGYFKDHGTYLYQEKFRQKSHHLQFFKNREKSQKIPKSQKISKSQIRCFPLESYRSEPL